MALGQERRIGRFDGYDLDGRLLFLQVLSRAAQGAAGADAGDEDIDGSICVVVDFRACRALWTAGLAGLVNWPGMKPCSSLANSSALSTAPACLGPFRQDDVCAVGCDELAPFDRHRFRHGEDGL